MDSFRVQPYGTGYFWSLQRYFSLMCIQHTALEMPCNASKIAMSLRLDFMLTGPSPHYQVKPVWPWQLLHPDNPPLHHRQEAVVTG